MPQHKGTPPKTKSNARKVPPEPGPKFCLLCDGTGLLCNICGESEKDCECTDKEVKEYELTNPDMTQFFECSECQ